MAALKALKWLEVSTSGSHFCLGQSLTVVNR
jgi:hypothetical protein